MFVSGKYKTLVEMFVSIIEFPSLHVFFFVFLFFCFVFFNSVLRPFSSFFTHIETDQSVGGAKTGVPEEKPPDTPASRTWLVPHVTRAPSEARTHIGEMIE